MDLRNEDYSERRQPRLIIQYTTQHYRRITMRPYTSEQNELTWRIIGCAVEVHKHLGPGLLEAVYESALCIELANCGLCFERQKPLAVVYKEHKIGDYKIDILVDNLVVVEVKSVEQIIPVFEAQILGYMKLGRYSLGLLLNFNSYLLKKGIKRFVL